MRNEKLFKPKKWSEDDILLTIDHLDKLKSKGFTVAKSLKVINNHKIIKRSPESIRKKLNQFDGLYFIKDGARGKLDWGRYFNGK
jgi:hypothetical protein